MRITVEFESLEEFQKHFAVNNDSALAIAQLGQKIDGLYKVGSDDVGGKLHKDIKDIDDVDQNYDHDLYLRVLNEFKKYIDRHPRSESAVREGIYNRIGDYEIPTGLSDEAYHRLLNYMSRLNM